MTNSVTGVTGVPFKARALDKATPELINNPGLYSGTGAVTPVNANNQPKKKGSIIKTLGKLVLWSAIIAGSLLAAKKWIPQVNKAAAIKDLAPDAKLMEKVCSRVSQAADWVDAKVVKKIAGLLSKGVVKATKTDVKQIPQKLIIDV